MEDNNSTLEQDTQKSSATGEPEIKPVKLSKRKTGVVLIVAAVILIIFVYIFRGCSVTKEVHTSAENTQKVQTEEVAPEENKNMASNTMETNLKNGDFPSNSEGSDSSRATASESSENSTNNSEVSNNVNPEQTEVSDIQTSDIKSIVEAGVPALGEEYTTSGLVSGKNIYNVNNNSYAYSVSFLIITGSDKYTTVKYFCPKKTFDALQEGDTVNVVYQFDNTGVISISSISK